MVKYLDELCSGMFSDELDKMGYRNQVVIGMTINNTGKFYGPAKTLQIEEMDTNDENIQAGLSYLGSLHAGDVLCVKGSKRFAYFGELMTRLSTRQGLSGVVIDGFTRDSHYTKTASLPVIAQGYSPVDIKGRGRVGDTNIPINLGNCVVTPGDYIFGDCDGVVVIPAAIRVELETRIQNVLQNERSIIEDIRSGKSVDYILKTYKEF